MTKNRRKGGAVGLRHIVKGLLKGAHDHAKEQKYLSRGLKFLGLNTAGNIAHHFGYGRKGAGVKAVKF